MTPSAFAGGSKKDEHDKYVKGKGQDSYKKDGHDKYVKGTRAYGKDKGSGIKLSSNSLFIK